jgi:hypothetical protein
LSNGAAIATAGNRFLLEICVSSFRCLLLCLCFLSAGGGVALAQQEAGHAIFSSPGGGESGPVRFYGIEDGQGEAGNFPGAGTLHSPITQVQYPLGDPSYDAPRGGAAPDAAPVSNPWVRYTKNTAELSWVLPGDAPDALGITTLELRNKVEFPRAPFLAIAPRAAMHLLNGPEVSDLPSRLYDASFETILSLPVGEGVFMQAAISPSIFTDGEATADSFRIPGRLLFFYMCGDEIILSAGVVYLDREDVGFFPTAGVIFKPSEDFKAELMIPRPRVAWRYSCEGGVENWVYVVGEFGGGSWAVRRASGADDVATLSDWRALAGWERIVAGGATLRAEAGYVFNRTLEYTSTSNETSLAGTGLVRIGLTY